MISRATAQWQGALTDGSGTTSLDSGLAKDLPLTWKARTEGEANYTTPEELIAAAHASCFSMALSHRLAQAGSPATSLKTSAAVTFERTSEGPKITQVALTLVGDVPGIDEAEFQKLAADAKDGCPVSNALKGNVEISLDAQLAV